jgi:hypothetical protein
LERPDSLVRQIYDAGNHRPDSLADQVLEAQYQANAKAAGNFSSWSSNRNGGGPSPEQWEEEVQAYEETLESIASMAMDPVLYATTRAMEDFDTTGITSAIYRLLHMIDPAQLRFIYHVLPQFWHHRFSMHPEGRPEGDLSSAFMPLHDGFCDADAYIASSKRETKAARESAVSRSQIEATEVRPAPTAQLPARPKLISPSASPLDAVSPTRKTAQFTEPSGKNHKTDLPPPMSVQALYDYETDDPICLSFKEGDIIQVVTQLESGWWDGVVNNVRGWFPSNYCRVIDPYGILETEALDSSLEDEFDSDGGEDDSDSHPNNDNNLWHSHLLDTSHPTSSTGIASQQTTVLPSEEVDRDALGDLLCRCPFSSCEGVAPFQTRSELKQHFKASHSTQSAPLSATQYQEDMRYFT